MSFVNRIKTLLLNRNTVVLLSIFAGIIVLWYIYNNQLNKVIKPIRIPVAARDLLETTQISAADITYVEVNVAFVKKANIITSAGAVTNKYIANGTSIKKGSPFYKEQIVDSADLKKRITEEAKENDSLYYLSVSFDSTYANSIYPGDRIDLWIKFSINEPTLGLKGIMFEPFITSIEVLKVLDSGKRNVFDGSGKRTPAYLVFSVDKETRLLLDNARDQQMTITPVARNKMYTENQAKTVIDDTIKDIINKKVIPFS